MKHETEIKNWLSIIGSSLTVDALVRSCRKALTAYPDSAELWNVFGEIMEEIGQSRESELAYQKSVSLEPGNASIWNSLGLLLKRNGRIVEAESAFLKAVLVDPNYRNLRRDRRKIFIDEDSNLDNYSEDDEIKGNRIQQLLMSFDPSVWISVVDEFLESGEQERATRILEKALRTHPNSQSISLKYSALLEQNRQFPEAALVLNRLIEIDPDIAEAWHRLSLLARLDGNVASAISFSRRSVKLNPANPHLRRLALLLDEQGKTLEAMEVLSQASEFDAITLNLLGVIQHKLGQRAEAKISYENALSVGGENSHLLNNLGRLFEDVGDDEGAVWAFDRALELDRHNAVAWNNFGIVLRHQEAFSEAEKAFRISISIAPHFKNPWLNLRDLSFSIPSISTAEISGSRLDEPIPSRWMQLGWNVFDEIYHSLQLKKLTNQAEQQPKNPYALHQLALCMFNAGLNQEAGALLRKAILVHNENPAFWNLLGMICEKLGCISDSIACYEQAIKCDNNCLGAIFNWNEARIGNDEENQANSSLYKIAS